MEEGSTKGFFSRLIGCLFKKDAPEDIHKEIQELIDAGEEKGALSEDEGSMLEAVLRLKTTEVRRVMVPRAEAVFLSVETGLRGVIEKIIETGHTRIPIYEGTIDNIVGIIHAKDLLAYWGGEGIRVRDILRPAHFIPETKALHELLKELNEHKSHMAVVLDEYGGTSGIVSLEDVLEELVGEIVDEYDFEEPLIQERGLGLYLADGRLPIEELKERFSLELPAGRYTSLAGLITHMLGRVPDKGEEVLLGPLKMTVAEADSRRVHQVEISLGEAKLKGDEK